MTSGTLPEFIDFWEGRDTPNSGFSFLSCYYTMKLVRLLSKRRQVLYLYCRVILAV